LSQLQRLIIEPTQRQEQTIALTPDQRHYLQRVLRLQVGDSLIVMDGQGQQWQVELADNLSTATILERLTTHTELPLSITLLIALPKGNGFDEVVRQATELGVKQIVPVLSDRTLLNPSPKKVERWQRITREAAEQSERTHLPQILSPLAFNEALNCCYSERAICYLGVARGNMPHFLPHLCETLACETLERDANGPTIPELVIATGPEGGWTDAEVAQAIQVGYQPISFGKRVFRAVTAPLVAMAIAAAALESR